MRNYTVSQKCTPHFLRQLGPVFIFSLLNSRKGLRSTECQCSSESYIIPSLSQKLSDQNSSLKSVNKFSNHRIPLITDRCFAVASPPVLQQFTNELTPFRHGTRRIQTTVQTHLFRLAKKAAH